MYLFGDQSSVSAAWDILQKTALGVSELTLYSFPLLFRCCALLVLNSCIILYYFNVSNNTLVFTHFFDARLKSIS